MQSIYNPHGLRDFALYLDELLEGEKAIFSSQNEFGEIAGVPPNTIKSIRRNRDLTPERFAEGKFHKPTIESVLAIAAVIPDPMTGEPFDPEGRPCRLEAVCRGWELLRPRPKKAKAPANPAVTLIKAAYNKNMSAFVKAGLSPEAMDRILAGDRPSIGELLQLQEALSLDFERLLDLYGVGTDAPLPNGQPNGSPSKV